MTTPAGGDWADHFSGNARDYARYRPSYPAELFSWLAGQAPARDCAWDIATGNGQAARQLAGPFRRVLASDASAPQISAARPADRVDWVLCRAEAAALASDTADLVTVAQALHWFVSDTFYDEVRRVARAGALVAVWTYALAAIHPPVDTILKQFHDQVMGPWWPPRRRHVVTGYRDLPFPFPEVETPTFTMTARWRLQDLLSYLGTWSSVARAQAETGADPLPPLAANLRPAWGREDVVRTVTWPLAVRAGRVLKP